MSTDNTITKTDLKNILEEIGNIGGSGDATPTPTANATAAFDSSAHMNSTDMTSTQVDDFVDGLNVTGTSVKWSQLKSETISSSSQRVDISSYIGQYDELLFMCRNASSQRHTPPILIPTVAISSWSNNTYYFEGGSYATASAYNGIRLLINKSGTTVKFGVDWDIFEGTEYNTVVTVYGK